MQYKNREILENFLISLNKRDYIDYDFRKWKNDYGYYFTMAYWNGEIIFYDEQEEKFHINGECFFEVEVDDYLIESLKQFIKM